MLADGIDCTSFTSAPVMLIMESLRPGRLVFRGLNLIDITLLLIFCIVRLFVLFVTIMFRW